MSSYSQGKYSRGYTETKRTAASSHLGMILLKKQPIFTQQTNIRMKVPLFVQSEVMNRSDFNLFFVL